MTAALTAFDSVGIFYQGFSQVEDAEVIALLDVHTLL